MKGRVPLLLAFTGGLMILASCSTLVQPRTVSQAPARALKVALTIYEQFAGGADPVSVAIAASFADASGAFVLSGKQQMTCSGVKLATAASSQTSVPRQPSGGAYTCVYTDGQGHKTTLLIPVPLGSFAAISPAPYAAVPIPTSARRPLPKKRFSGPRRPSEFISALSLQYQFPILPHHATATITAWSWSPNPRPGVVGAKTPAGGTYTLSDAQAAYGLGFEDFRPGPGSIALDSTIAWTAPAGGFHAVQITYVDNLIVPVIWTSSQAQS